MALEKVLLASCAKGAGPNTLHFLEFYPCVLLGYGQSVEDEAEAEFCRKNGIEINRRISGGGCIYMDGGVLGWEIIAKKNTPGLPGNLEDMYRRLCGGLAAALGEFGIHASFRPPNDVEAGGGKISGTGGTELDDSLIFHGSLLAGFDAGMMEKALKNPDKKNKGAQGSIPAWRTVSIKDLLGYAPPMDDLKKSLAGAFAGIFGVEFERGGLTAEEEKRLNEELPLFQSDEWVYERRGSGLL